jgi:uncharacterized membrane protein
MNGPVIQMFHRIVEWAAAGIEAIAVLFIVAAVINLAVRQGTVRYLYQLGKPGAFTAYKQQLGQALLLSLELMVAADVIRTVTFEPTLINVGILGLLVLIRTFLSWAMSVELEGRWPWKASELRAGEKNQQENG